MNNIKGFTIGLLAGCALMLAMPTMAATVKKKTYTLTEADYPIEVNGLKYANAQLPILNYKGSTYVPLRAVGDLLGASVEWSAALKKVEIRGDGSSVQNNAYRNIKVSGQGGHYTVTGEGRVFEAVMSYAVEDGHNYLLEQNVQLDEGAPAWSPFQLNIVIPAKHIPSNGTLMLELFEYSAKDGTKINILSVPLETFAP
ncbi:Gmad2 immunoglobulin-like domain-containing protein [Cohnella yongneupensis]|uniref:Gmad2 immunoglobulin-like domain-containing protein n=1 Tax=Cohnella yongneupensis TaxID=425006 RepID=A0ABW0R017_9BACL